MILDPDQTEGGESMGVMVKMTVQPEEIIEAVRRMRKEDRIVFLEDLLAATSPEYLASIREARRDYKAGRIKTHKEVFGR
jgi:L-alanine-DL-glutamate epimerase-like enolase superfamily enzyme